MKKTRFKHKQRTVTFGVCASSAIFFSLSFSSFRFYSLCVAVLVALWWHWSRGSLSYLRKGTHTPFFFSYILLRSLVVPLAWIGLIFFPALSLVSTTTRRFNSLHTRKTTAVTPDTKRKKQQELFYCLCVLSLYPSWTGPWIYISIYISCAPYALRTQLFLRNGPSYFFYSYLLPYSIISIFGCCVLNNNVKKNL